MVRNCWVDWTIKSPNRQRRTSRKLSSTSRTIRRINSAWKSPLGAGGSTFSLASTFCDDSWTDSSCVATGEVTEDEIGLAGALLFSFRTSNIDVSSVTDGFVSCCVGPGYCGILYIIIGLLAKHGLEKVSLASPFRGEKSELFLCGSSSLEALTESSDGNLGIRWASPIEESIDPWLDDRLRSDKQVIKEIGTRDGTDATAGVAFSINLGETIFDGCTSPMEAVETTLEGALLFNASVWPCFFFLKTKHCTFSVNICH